MSLLPVSYSRLLFSALLAAAVVGACREPDDIAGDLLPGAQVLVLDSVIVSMESERLDSVLTYLQTDIGQPFAVQQVLIGETNDPLFGQLNAECAVQVLLGDTDVEFGPSPDSLRFDSLRLHLSFLFWEGNIQDPMSFRVYELNEPLDTIAYYSNTAPLATGPQLAPFNRIRMDTTLGARKVVVPLPASLGERFLFLDTTALQNDSAFIANFHGLKLESVRANPTSVGNMLVLNVTNIGATFIRLHYQELDPSGEWVPRSFDFPVFFPRAGFTRFTRSNFSGTFVQTELANPESPYLFLQGGALIRLRMLADPRPIANLTPPVLINRAILQLPIAPEYEDETGYFQQPFNLLGFPHLADGYRVDTTAVEFNPYGLNPFNEEKGYYEVDLTNYLQQILTDDSTNTGFSLYPPSFGQSTNRVVLASPNHPTFRPRVVVYYTPIP